MGDKEDKEFHPSQDEEYDDDEEYDETPCSVCEVPGLNIDLIKRDYTSSDKSLHLRFRI